VTVLRAQPVSREIVEYLLAQPALKDVLTTWRPSVHQKPVELDPSFVSAVHAAVREVYPEDASLFDSFSAPMPVVLSVRHARRLGALFCVADRGRLRKAGVDPKALTAFAKCFTDCGLQGWGLLLELAEPTVKPPTKLQQLAAENERLRALLEKHGIDPDEA
jgi:hypothetical protein